MCVEDDGCFMDRMRLRRYLYAASGLSQRRISGQHRGAAKQDFSLHGNLNSWR